MATRAASLVVLCFCAAVALCSTGASASTSLVQSTKWDLCASKTYAVQIKDVFISPDPVEAGKLATFTIPAYASEPVDGGTVVVTVSFHGIKIHTEKDDLCSKSSCPITGDFTLNNSEPLPQFTPPGQYKLKFQVLDYAGKELACASITFNIVWKTELDQLVEAESALEKKMSKRPFNFPLNEML
jgi:hypothetical protein